MKFKAINLKNEVVFGNGVTMASEKIEYWSDNVNVEENVKKYGEEWREDASNGDLSIERNKVRHKIVPYLEKTLDKNLVEHLYKICGFLSRSVSP